MSNRQAKVRNRQSVTNGSSPSPDITNVLLSFSEDIAHIRSRHALLQAIMDKLKPIFEFDEAAIMIKKGTEDAFFLMHSDENSETTDNIHCNFFQQPEIHVSGTAYEEVFGLDRPTISTLAHYKEKYPDYPGVHLMDEMGYVEHLIIPLWWGSKKLGTLEFHASVAGRLGQISELVLRRVADQMALAVTNILTSEQLKLERKQKRNHQSVTEAITHVASGSELIHVIFETFKQILPFDDVNLLHVDSENSRERDLTIDYGYDLSRNISNLQQQRVSGWLPLSKISEFVLDKGVVTLEASEFKNFDHQNFNNEGVQFFQELIAGALKMKDRVIGVLYLWSKQGDLFEDQISLFQSLLEQLSIALSNILDGEKLHASKEDLENQLSLNQSLIKIKGFHALGKALCDQLGKNFDFNRLVLTLFSERTRTHSLVYQRQENEFQELIGNNDQPNYSADQSLKPRILVNETFKNSAKTSPRYRSEYDLGMRSGIELPFYIDEGRSAVLTLFSTSTEGFDLGDLTHLRQYTYPIALALQNQLAFEEIRGLKDQLEQEKQYLEGELHLIFGEIVGNGPQHKKLLEAIKKVAPTHSTVLIIGETGTGKELVARAIHNASERKHSTLIKINCAALPAELIESELFGHEKGAFTGATSRRIGKFELANNSTIFLDEIGELPLNLQTKILRVLQEREFERIGSNKVIMTNARIIAATNRNLANEVEAGRFRSDLYYRLKVYPIMVPPLRRRKEDIPCLLEHFVKVKEKKLGKKVIFTADDRAVINYHWPGNIRELEHTVERAIIEASPDGEIELEIPDQSNFKSTDTFKLQSYEDAERELILNTLMHCGARIRGAKGAAEVLGIPPSTLESRMKRLGIERSDALKDRD